MLFLILLIILLLAAVPSVALQQRLGLLSKWRTGHSAVDPDCADVDWLPSFLVPPKNKALTPDGRGSLNDRLGVKRNSRNVCASNG